MSNTSATTGLPWRMDGSSRQSQLHRKSLSYSVINILPLADLVAGAQRSASRHVRSYKVLGGLGRSEEVGGGKAGEEQLGRD